MAEGTICIDFNGENFVFDINEVLKKPINSENLCYVYVIDPLVQDFLEIELLPEKLRALDVYEQTDVEAATWCDLISSQGLTDKENEEAIKELCQKLEFAGTAGALLPTSMEEFSDGELEQNADATKNPLPTSPTSRVEKVTNKPEVRLPRGGRLVSCDHQQRAD